MGASHELTEENKMHRYNMALALLSQFNKKGFLFQIITNVKSGYFTTILSVKNHE